MIYCGKKSNLNKFNRVYLPKDIIVEFNDDGSDRTVRLKTGKENYSDTYPRLPYVTCGCENKNKYYYYSDNPKSRWEIHHNLKGRPIIQLYNSNDELINGEIHYLDLDRIEVIFSKPVSGYAICLLVKNRSMIYYGDGTEWNIEHNLEAKPFTQVFDSMGYMVNAEIKHIDENNTKITFSERIRGYAILITDPTDSYVHTQTVPNKEWTVRHNFNRNCLVQLIDPELYVEITDIRHVNRNEVKIYFSKPVTGEAVCVAGDYSRDDNDTGGVIVVNEHDLPDVKDARLNTIYVLKPSGYSYITNDNFQWIAINVGPSRIDGNEFKSNDTIVNGNRQNDNEIIIDESKHN